jgi:hypothetical protein
MLVELGRIFAIMPAAVVAADAPECFLGLPRDRSSLLDYSVISEPTT